jgi:hypothetical protein
MAKLEELTRGATVKDILPDALITVVDVQWHRDMAITLTYRDAAGRLGHEILYRDRAVRGRWWYRDIRTNTGSCHTHMATATTLLRLRHARYNACCTRRHCRDRGSCAAPEWSAWQQGRDHHGDPRRTPRGSPGTYRAHSHRELPHAQVHELRL